MHALHAHGIGSTEVAVPARCTVCKVPRAREDAPICRGAAQGGSRKRTLAAYRAPNENCGLVTVTFLSCFQTDNIHEVVQRLNHRGISSVEGSDLFFGNGLVRGKGLQDGGCQWGINLFIKLQEN